MRQSTCTARSARLQRLPDKLGVGTREGDRSACAARVAARPLHNLTQLGTLTAE